MEWNGKRLVGGKELAGLLAVAWRLRGYGTCGDHTGRQWLVLYGVAGIDKNTLISINYCARYSERLQGILFFTMMVLCASL